MVNKKEEMHLQIDSIERASTKWEFRGFSDVFVKVVLDRHTLLGTGPLPDWLGNLAHSRSMVALDNYRDNPCLRLCIAVNRGARPDRCTNAARVLVKGFFKFTYIFQMTAPKRR